MKWIYDGTVKTETWQINSIKLIRSSGTAFTDCPNYPNPTWSGNSG